MPKSHGAGKKISGANTQDARAHIPSFHRCSLNSPKEFFPISIPITVNHYHVQAICLRITINLKITLSGHEETRNSTGNFSVKCLFFFLIY